MKHIYCPEIEGLDASLLGIEGASKMMVKLISEDTVRVEILPGGFTPLHVHDDKERIVIMTGTGEIKSGDGKEAAQPGDFAEFDRSEPHQILNNSDNILAFMCFRNQR
ncbi:MAG: cupin domain-containing protein [Proteobacteria bacterium]|nr:cupin domain-containing protein [Pseudomonadota bacterium]